MNSLSLHRRLLAQWILPAGNMLSFCHKGEGKNCTGSSRVTARGVLITWGLARRSLQAGSVSAFRHSSFIKRVKCAGETMFKHQED